MLDLIERLSAEQRQVLTLKFVFDFSNAEVASILDKTEGAVKSLQHRALASLQKHIARLALQSARSRHARATSIGSQWGGGRLYLPRCRSRSESSACPGPARRRSSPR